MKEIKEIKNIYICLDAIENNQVIKKILVEFMDNTKDYFMLSDRYYKNNFKKQDKLYQEFEKKIEPYINKAMATDYTSGPSKLIMVDKNDEKLNNYVEECITDIDKKLTIASENTNLVMACLNHLVSSISYSVFSFPSLSVPVAISASLRAFRDNYSYQEDTSGKKIIKNIKLFTSMSILTMQISSLITGVFNLYIHPETFKYYKDFLEASFNTSKIRLSHENPFHNKIQLFDDDDEKNDIIMNGIENNPNLDSEDLSVAKSLINYIEDNPYFDYEKLYDNLSSFSVIHAENYDNDTSASAYYIVHLNTISMLQDSYLSDEWYQKCLRHEIIHATGYLNNSILTEGMTAILEDEYGDNSNNSAIEDAYFDHRLITKVFCELITPDKMLEAFSKRDMSIIHDEMLKLYDDEKNYKELMNYLKEYGNTFQDKRTSVLISSNTPLEEYPKYQLLRLFMPYIHNANLTEEQQNYINIYLSEIGNQSNISIKSYFNYRLPDYSREFEDCSIQK